MKILHINEFYRDFGGAEKYLFDLCSDLEQSGNQIVIISSSDKEHISVPGRKEYFVNPSYGLRSSLKMWGVYKNILDEEKPDIIHLHNTHYFVSPIIIKKLMRFVPVVKFVHDAILFCPSLGRKVIPESDEMCSYPVGYHCFNKKGCYPFRFEGGSLAANLHKFFLVAYNLRISRLLDKTIVGSRYMYNELIRNGFAADKIELIPCYTDKGLDDNLSYPDRKNVVLCIGRFDEGKGIPQFVESLSYIRDLNWDAEVVGDGRSIKESEEKIRRLGLEKKIKILGRLSSEEIDKSYKQCSVVVMPSMVPESFGLVGIEAMSFGKPVVAFDSGGIKDWLLDGETGFLVKRGDNKCLADRISCLLENESLARDMGRRGKERVEKLYRKDIQLKRLLAVYEEVVNKRARLENH